MVAERVVLAPHRESMVRLEWSLPLRQYPDSTNFLTTANEIRQNLTQVMK
jgi:hypothetical protein